jgi:plastocyanin
MRGTLLIVCMLLALSGCKSRPMPPAGGGNNNVGGGPTTPDPIATTGTISGAVTSRNVGVSGAIVSLGSASSVTTGISGEYSFPDVAPGTRTVTLAPPRLFTLASGETATKSTTVTAGQTSTINWALTQGPVGPQPVTFVVFLDASAFRPRDVTIARGDTVLWSNAQPIFHTISPDDRNQPGAWRTENMPARTGASFSHVFDTEGTFNYSCTVHIGMTGVVRVR